MAFEKARLEAKKSVNRLRVNWGRTSEKVTGNNDARQKLEPET
jgi:hypothetical protein